MKLNFTIKRVFITLFATFISMQMVKAQGDCYTLGGCSDYSNFGYSSTTAATLEYDNYVSGFHSTVVRDVDGTLKIWGEMTQADGKGFYLVPTPINPGNYPGLTGKPLKVAIGSSTIRTPQFILLTDDDKLWTWGNAGSVLDKSLTTYTNEYVADSDVGGASADVAPFQELSLGLPTGVTASDVKMMFATHGVFVITTCSGEVYAIVQFWGNVGNGATSATNVWHKVQKSASAGGGDLTGVVATRGSHGGFLALDDTGNLWAWGYKTWDGVNPAAHQSAAIPVTLPSGATGSIKMIGVTGSSGGDGRNTYYVLYENGSLYALGNNEQKQLGNWTTTSSSIWVQPRYESVTGPVIDNIKWISPNEHSNHYTAINVLTADKKLFSWGEENKHFLGRGLGMSTVAVDPGEPVSFEAGYSNEDIIAVETGGHTTMMLRECEDDFGYMGHRVNGSMGDNSPVDEVSHTVHFNTNAVQVCGAETVEATLRVSLNGPYCVGNTVSLIGSPIGGTYSIESGLATIDGNELTFTGEGTVRVSYTVSSGSSCGGTVTVNQLLNVVDCTPILNIPGMVWNDVDGDAIKDAGENGLSNGLWANLVDPDGHVIASIRVEEDGTYNFVLSTTSLIKSGDYKIVLTNTVKYVGEHLAAADVPNNDFGYTGVNRGTSATADNANRTGVQSIGDLSGIITSTTLDEVNFGISNDPNVLPVVLKFFNVVKDNNNTLLKWATATEQNNLGFEIERSNDGSSWVSIGFVHTKAKDANSNTTLYYEYVDIAPLQGTNYYRLKQVDFDGKHDYSTIQMVNFISTTVYRIYPNPVNSIVAIEGLSGVNTIKVISVSGQTVYTVTVTNESVKQLNLSALSEGVYIIQVTNTSGETVSQKIIKQ